MCIFALHSLGNETCAAVEAVVSSPVKFMN